MSRLNIKSTLSFTAACITGAALLAPSTAHAIDTDGDTVPDLWDAYPDDPRLASVGYSPSQGQFGMIMFEDRWPNRFDFDFNDAVVAYNYKYRFNAQNRVMSLRATFDVLAVGGTEQLGLGLRIEEAYRSEVSSVTVTIGPNGTPMTRTPFPGDQLLTFEITNDMRRDLFGGTTGQINSSVRTARLRGLPIAVEIEFRSPQWLAPMVAPHDLFIFRTNDTTHEVHRSYILGSSRMDPDRFNTGDDGSNEFRTFTDTRGIPFAIVLAEVSPYPGEGVDLADLYPNIMQFAQSAGTVFTAFYNGTRDLSAAYIDSAGQGMFQPQFLTCVNDPDCPRSSR